MLLFIVFFVVVATGCHPECVNTISNVTRNAICNPICDRPTCIYNCTIPNADCENYVPECEVRCPPDQCESDSCPACETVCIPVTPCDTHNCTLLCTMLNCGWDCVPPSTDGTWTCENASCVASAAAATHSSLLLFVILGYILFLHG
jgi:hypothetical protein